MPLVTGVMQVKIKWAHFGFVGGLDNQAQMVQKVKCVPFWYTGLVWQTGSEYSPPAAPIAESTRSSASRVHPQLQ